MNQEAGMLSMGLRLLAWVVGLGLATLGGFLLVLLVSQLIGIRRYAPKAQRLAGGLRNVVPVAVLLLLVFTFGLLGSHWLYAQAETASSSSPTVALSPTPTLYVSIDKTVTPTATPLPRTMAPMATPTAPTETCLGTYDAVWIEDGSFADSSTTTKGTRGTKTWVVQNTGTCAWDEHVELVSLSAQGVTTSSAWLAKGRIEPGQTAMVSVDIAISERPGRVYAEWRLRGADGRFFGHFLWLNVIAE